MDFSLFIAVHHLRAKKRRSAVGAISSIAMGGIAVCAFALVVVLSVFNGIESVVGALYSTLETDLRIVSRAGKGFAYDSAISSKLRALPEGTLCGELLEENALFGYHDRQHVGRFLGMDSTYARITSMGEHCVDGAFMLYRGSQPMANLAVGVSYYLGASPAHFDPVTIYVPNRLAANWLNPATAFKRKTMSFEGLISINGDFDEQSVVIPIEVARELLDYDSTRVSALALTLPANSDVPRCQRLLQNALGPDFTVMQRHEQNSSLYRTMRSERLIITLILSLILLLATFNVVGSLAMLMLDKQADVETLRHLGATGVQVRRIFLYEGLLISLIGGAVGIVVGLLLCWVQQTFGLVTLHGSGAFVVDAYPVEVRAHDILYIFVLVAVLGYVAAWLPTLSIRKMTEA